MGYVKAFNNDQLGTIYENSQFSGLCPAAARRLIQHQATSRLFDTMLTGKRVSFSIGVSLG